MTDHVQEINRTLRSIAEITLNLPADKTAGLEKASKMMAGIQFNEEYELCAMFNAVHDMTTSYLEKVLEHKTDNIEPVNDGIVLLRSIARSEAIGKTFGFVDKDIADVVENLKAIRFEDETIQIIGSLPRTLKDIAAITLNISPANREELKKVAEILPGLSVDKEHSSYTLFSAVRDMTCNCIEKLLADETDDIEAVQEGIILLRSMARSEAAGKAFGFADRDIAGVIENLKTIKTENETSKKIERLSRTLKEIAAITLNIAPDNLAGLKKVATMLPKLSVDKVHSTYTLFSAVRDMTSSYIRKLLANDADDLETLKDAVVLLRAIVISTIAGNDFGFEAKDIAGVIDNLNVLRDDSDPVQEPDSEPTDSEAANRFEEQSKDDYQDLIGILLAEIQALICLSTNITGDDIPKLGIILNALAKFEENLSGELFNDILKISKKIRGYIKKLIINVEVKPSPIADGLILLRAMLRSLYKNKPFSFGIDDVVESLGDDPTVAFSDVSPEVPEKEKPEEPIRDEIVQPVTNLSDEDTDILGDFILEARDNLESIEIGLIELEQTPEDTEIINAIFRPFHTIKGVSGFLDLKKINALSHSTENLLDSSRQGDFIIDHDIADTILKAVDVLKQLIDKVEQGLEIGKTADDSDIRINSLISRIEALNQSGGNDSETTKPLGEMLVGQGTINDLELSKALKTQQKFPEKKLGEILVEDQKIESREIISALRGQKRVRRQAAPQVKVDTNKLDNLVDLTGELVIAQSMLRQRNSATSVKDQKLLQNLNQLGQIVSNIQKIAMSMRMVPIKATFQKMVRLVRDLSRNCKKDVALEMFGEDTEIDRNVVEALYEPMVHMIRNSIDHGLETDEEREASEKAAKGTVSLRAYHKGGNIVIEISDNGKGLSKFNILEKAINSGLITGEEDLSDADIFQLIMAPGFSTAETITDISGRGVGMDVVKKAIKDLNGRIDIQSVEGEGSTFTISLPLTLAIIEGMLVRVGQEKFIIPTMAIVESFRPTKKDYYTVEQKNEMLMFRESLIPIVRLNRICEVSMDSQNIWENIVVVVESKDDQRGILIDELLGKEEFVIKNLGETLKGIKGLAGGAILGDGRVGLIIDISGIFDAADSFHSAGASLSI